MGLFRTLVLSLALLSAGAAFAQHEGHELVEVLIGTASTPAQRETLATRYPSEASKARSQAALHRRMEKRYGTTKIGPDSRAPLCEAKLPKRRETRPRARSRA
jgi:hypothetical protein